MNQHIHKKLFPALISLLALSPLLTMGGVYAKATHHPLAVHETSPKRVKQHANSSFPLTIKDQTGRKVTILHKPTRVLSLTLATDEILTSILPLKELIGVEYDATSPLFSHIVKIVKNDHIRVWGNAEAEPSAESIIAAHPSLVLVADYNNQNVVRQLVQAGIPVYEFSQFNSLSEIEKNILITGRLVGEEPHANSLVQGMKKELNRLKNKAPKQKQRVLVYTSYQNVISVPGINTTANDVIAAAGGVNAASHMNGWANISAEELLVLNPDIIVIPNDTGATNTALIQFMKNPLFKDLKAVKSHHVYSISDGNFSAVSQYVTLGVKEMQHILLATSTKVGSANAK